ncbi:MAG: PHA/PHB synthase family protein, partial [Rhodospirillaceae bacterium]
MGSPSHAGPPSAKELEKLYADIAQKSTRLVRRWLLQQTAGTAPAWQDDLGIAQAFNAAWSRLLSDPAKLCAAHTKAWQDYSSLWQWAALRLLGHRAEPVAMPDPSDRRFKSDDWQRSFVFDYIKQSYLIAARHLHALFAGIDGLDPQTAKKVDFYTRQYIDALAPSNFVLTNPDVLRATVASGGHNLLRGLDNLLEDLLRGNGEGLRVRMTDEGAFALGVNIATTPGKIVFQNELMQLIQYEPATEQVYRRPLLVVPPWINKYYILDLRPENSFVKWAVEQGHTVFVISWINPDAQQAKKTFEDYLNDGPLAALDAIRSATGEAECNVIGFCLGGTLLACTLAHLAGRGDTRIASATFFASLIDFSEPGELGVFIDEQQVQALERRMEKRGYLEGREMATTFNMLRANDLVWSFVVSNYLLGREPLAFDLLYWNADSTRMPAAMHSYYLRNMYLGNKLATPGGLVLNGQPLDVTKVQVPSYFISTVEDHIAPWRTTYRGARLFTGPVRFVLGGSGHIAGIINPPAANKYCYWTNAALPDVADDWLQGAERHDGSWWTDWARWAAERGGGHVPRRIPGAGKLPVIEDAPGSYVRLRID